jgi:hypothetical protein
MYKRKNQETNWGGPRETKLDWDDEFPATGGRMLAPIAFGHKYEPVAAQMYADWFQTTLMAPGIVEHPCHTWLTASPDRMDLRNGLLVEIKCAYTRVLPSQEIPAKHWVQMQIAMACCGMRECCYVEFSLNNNTRVSTQMTPDNRPMLFVRKVEYDPVWFYEHLDALYAFYSETMNSMKRRPRAKTLTTGTASEPYIYTSRSEQHRFDCHFIPAPTETTYINPDPIPGMPRELEGLEVPDCVAHPAWKPSKFIDDVFKFGLCEYIDLDPEPNELPHIEPIPCIVPALLTQ